MPEPPHDVMPRFLLQPDPEPPHDVGSKSRRSTLLSTMICLIQMAIDFKEQLGYGARDFYYNKKRCGLDVATLEDIDISQCVEKMVTVASAERKLMNTKIGFEIYNATKTPGIYIKTYTEWLRLEGKLREILSYKAYNNWPTTVQEESNGDKHVGHGTLKGLPAMAKGMTNKPKKLKVEFSPNRGGPCGENRRTFVDEVVMFTRMHGTLRTMRKQGKRYGKLPQNPTKAGDSTFSAAYKAYTTYELRMKNKPKDLDIVECGYLNMYFGSKKFEVPQ
ncbi:hypothetical protein EJB05_33928 [Eragrostis curvula]|uniref:Uncharacterized protein n=1 Tax=Eragrostis curvula TaxID=38414 RepID=A0A5J9U3P8_9POAL|nr:hypothetical protein EJB05_33928 [Eragrostis curvula]